MVMSASSDRMLKIWDLRKASAAVSSFKCAYGIEDFCQLPSGEIVLANGPLMTIVNVEEDQSINRNQEYQAF